MTKPWLFSTPDEVFDDDDWLDEVLEDEWADLEEDDEEATRIIDIEEQYYFDDLTPGQQSALAQNY